MKFTKRVQLGLFVGLVALNIILRIPTVPHEIGIDSFDLHIWANSVSAFGEARWWAHPLSVVGFYPLSYASAVPFILSGISQCTGMDVELVILLYSFILGFFSIFAAYLLAGVIWNDDLFKFLVAFVFSTSQGILTFSTWTANARTLFVIILPLFIYLLLKARIFKIRYSILTFIILMLLLATHNYIYFIGPIIIAYFVVVVLYKLGKYIGAKPIKIPEYIINIAVFASFLVMFSIPFLISRDLWLSDPETMRAGVGSRYTLMFFMLSNYVRYIGILIIFVVGGYIYLSLKQGKRFEEWFLLVALVGLAPFLYVSTYMKWFIATFAFLLIGIALANIAAGAQINTHTYKTKKVKNKKVLLASLVVILLSSIIFTGYYQDIHFIVNPPHYDRYMKEQTYIAGMWIRDNIDKNMFYDHSLTGIRTFAVSEVPTLQGGAIGLTYGFYKSVTDINISKNSPLSVAFYLQGPISKTPHTQYIEGDIYYLSRSEIDSYYGKRFIHKYNLSYVIEDEGISDSVFIRSVHQEKSNLFYDNGKIRIWRL